jgi:hypothetical protein
MKTIVYMDDSHETFAVLYPIDGWVMCFDGNNEPAKKWIPAWRVRELRP